MSFRDNTPMVYRTAETAPAPRNQVTVDEEKFDTLKNVQNILTEAVEGLYKDFNAFYVPEGKTTQEAAEILLFDITGKKLAYEILSPVLEAVTTAVGRVDQKYKEGN